MTLETILRTVLYAVAWSAFVVFCGVVAGVGVRWILRLLCHALAETGRRCGRWAAMMLASLALVCGVIAQKANTNVPSDGVSAPAPMMSAARGAPETLPPWPQRVRPVPATARGVEVWELRGAYDDAIRIPAEGWDFRMTNGFIEGMTVLSRGEFRPDVGHLYFPRPFTNDLAFLPQSRWELLPSGGESKLWYAATPSNSLLVTWVNGLLDRNPLTPTNFQAEFFPDGSYEYRYPDHCELHPFVLPFDRDGDGLENTVDPDPETAGPDAHNTNAEWYNVVCSNIVSAVEDTNGVDLLWKDGVDSNAYYFVDVSVSRAPAPVYFVADGPSRLGDPVIVATLGATNHVPLLIGATYSVTSDAPFTVRAEANVDVVATGPTSCTVCSPLTFTETTEDVGGCLVHTFTAMPDLNGAFGWNVVSGGNSRNGAVSPLLMSSGGLGLLSAAPDCGFQSSGNQAWFSCPGEGENCGCGGCTAIGTFGYEDYTHYVASIGCGCTHDEGSDPQEDPMHVRPSFSVSFSRPAVIYEDAYQNLSNGYTVAKQSTKVRVTVSAAGGSNGGAFTLTKRLNLDRLAPVDGGTVSFDESVTLGAYEPYSRTFLCEGASPSAGEGDVELEGHFIERRTNARIDGDASLTVVRLELEAVYAAPENTCANRHVYGVGEKVRLRATPQLKSVVFSTTKNDRNDHLYEYELFYENLEMVDGSDDREYICPISANYRPSLKVGVAGVDYWPNLTLVEPNEVVTPGASWGENKVDFFYEGNRKCWEPGNVGEACLVTTNYIGPMYVSFRGIAVSEVPCSELDVVTGSFTNHPVHFQTHTRRAGAGLAHCIQDGNFWFVDGARSSQAELLWAPNSTMSWKIPIGWHRKSLGMSVDFPVFDVDYERIQEDSTRPLLVGGRVDAYKQIRHIDDAGVFRTDKFGHWITRSPMCRVILDGEILQWIHPSH